MRCHYMYNLMPTLSPQELVTEDNVTMERRLLVICSCVLLARVAAVSGVTSPFDVEDDMTIERAATTPMTQSDVNTTRFNDTELTPLDLFVALKRERYPEFYMPPRPDKKRPVAVVISVYISYLADINEADQEYTMEVYLRQYWTDPRLQFADEIPHVESLSIPDVYYRDVWTPDVHITNGKMEREHDVTKPNQMFRVHANGSITYSIRLTLTVWCKLDLVKFPMDTQNCSLSFGSYRYLTSEMTLAWKAENPIQMAPQRLAMFEMPGSPTTSMCDQGYTTGTFPCLRFHLEFKRLFGHYQTQVYIPSVLIVCLSWISLWLDPESVPGRVSLGILTILAMTNRMGSATSSALPRVSYLKAMDVWMTGCMSFLFVSVVEFAVVNTLIRCPWVKPRLPFQRTENRQTGDRRVSLPNGLWKSCARRRRSISADPNIRTVDSERQSEIGGPKDSSLVVANLSSQREVDS